MTASDRNSVDPMSCMANPGLPLTRALLSREPRAVAIPATDCFSTLPIELIEKINAFLTEPDRIALSGTCRELHAFFQPDLNKQALNRLLQAIVHDDRATVKKLLDNNPYLLLEVPLADTVIKSHYTQQTWIADMALTMAVQCRQIEMIKLLLSYFDKLPKTQTILQKKEKSLAAWTHYETQKNARNLIETVILPEEYTQLAKYLIGVFSVETFPHGNAVNSQLSDVTEDAITALLDILIPKTATKLDNIIHPEIFLLALLTTYHVHFNRFQNEAQRNAFCVRVVGLTQSALCPEAAKFFCEGLEYVLREGRDLSPRAISLQLKGHQEGVADDKPFYRLHREPLSGLGRDYFCADTGCYTAENPRAWTMPASMGLFMSLLNQYCQAKIAMFRQLVLNTLSSEAQPVVAPKCIIS